MQRLSPFSNINSEGNFTSHRQSSTSDKVQKSNKSIPKKRIFQRQNCRWPPVSQNPKPTQNPPELKIKKNQTPSVPPDIDPLAVARILPVFMKRKDIWFTSSLLGKWKVPSSCGQLGEKSQGARVWCLIYKENTKFNRTKSKWYQNCKNCRHWCTSKFCGPVLLGRNVIICTSDLSNHIWHEK